MLLTAEQREPGVVMTDFAQDILDIARCGLPAAEEYQVSGSLPTEQQRLGEGVARSAAASGFNARVIHQNPGLAIWCDGEIWMQFPSEKIGAAMETRNRMAHDSPTARWEVRCDVCGKPPAPLVRADRPWSIECQCRRGA